MTGPEVQYVQDTVENEGFDYTFRHYTEFEDIDDAEFHRLRLDYVAAAEALAEYTGTE